MQTPEVVLNNLAKQAKNKDFSFKRLYRILYNPDFYVRAYGSLYAKEGNLTSGTDGKTIDGFGMTQIEEIIQEMKDLSYKPIPSRRVEIPKANGKTRPIGIPSIKDKLVQTVVKEILEAIYDQNFKDSSHGFRPNRSCHTALSNIKKSCTGTKWWIEGDIEGFFDNINHHILIKQLRKRISDEKFINLIWKFLKAGYVAEWQYHKTYTGTPQGGIISPILANIYLHPLDVFMDKYKYEFGVGKERAINKEYKKHEGYVYKLKKRLAPNWENLSNEEKAGYLEKIKERKRILRTLPKRDPYDPNFKRLNYIRYADDFLISCIGSKADAEEIKKEVHDFLKEELKLNLSMEKTKITQGIKKARFLGYDIFVCDSSSYKKLPSGVVARTLTGHVMLSLPHDKIRDFLFDNKYIKEIKKEGNKNEWESVSKPGLRHIEDLEILSAYNAELRGFYQYYKLASDVCRIGNIYNLVYFSCLKTLAGKYKTSCSKILSNKVKGHKFLKNNEFGVYYTKKDKSKGEIEEFRPFLKNEFKVDKSKINWEDNVNVDVIPNVMKYSNSRTGIEQRLRSNVCEICGKTEGKHEVHHVKKIKDLKGKKRWEQIMISRKRKTLVLCHDCHVDLHSGKLD